MKFFRNRLFVVFFVTSIALPCTMIFREAGLVTALSCVLFYACMIAYAIQGIRIIELERRFEELKENTEKQLKTAICDILQSSIYETVKRKVSEAVKDARDAHSGVNPSDHIG